MFADAVDAGYTQDKLQCVANDVDIGEADVNFYCITDDPVLHPCTPTTPLVSPNRITCAPGDHIIAKVDALIENSAKERFDMGLWILDPGLTGDANTGSSCTQYNLIPNDGHGSVDLDGDLCGDVNSTTSLITVPLDNLDLTCPSDGSTTISIQACAGWSNSTSGGNDVVCPIPGVTPITDGFRQGTTPPEGSKCKCSALPLPIDVQAALTLVKTLTNDNGGTATLANFTLTAAGPTTISGTTGQSTVTHATVPSGTYALSETTVANYTAGSWSCSGGTLSGTNVTLASGGSATCTIVNNDNPSKLTLVKTLTNDNGGTATLSNFTLTAAGPTTISGTTGQSSVTNANVNAGSPYALSETTVANYTAGPWSCTNGGGGGGSVTVTFGTSVTCTINNNDNPSSLTLVKTLTNDNGGTAVLSDFTLRAAGPTTISGTTGQSSVTNAAVNAGSPYALSETTVANYTASAWSCTNGGGGSGSVTVTFGTSVTCTINNNDNPSKLTLVKTLTNDNGGTATLGNFTLKAAGPTTITGTTGQSTVTNANVNAGSPYALSETTVANYTAGGWSCTNGGGGGSSVTVVFGTSVTCTINNNDNPATLTIIKYLKGTSTTFSYTSSGGLSPSSFTLTPPGAACNPAAPAGSTCDQVVYNNLVAGNYAITEATKSGYILTDLSCDGVTGNLATRTASTTLAIGDSKTCIFVNEEIVGGLTRTQGFWATHMNLLSAVWFGTEYPPGSGEHPYTGLSLADRTICPAGAPTQLILTDISQVLGGFWAGVSKTSSNKSRSDLDQARMQLLQQLLAAISNHGAFNSSPGGTIGIDLAKTYFCTGTIAQVKDAAQQMAIFNTSGDNGVFTPGGSAQGKVAKDAADIPFWDVLIPTNP
jgi:hypothetical protein